MEIRRKAVAGTLESSDVYVEIEPGRGGIDVSLDSVVQAQFGEDILRVVDEVLAEQGVSDAVLRIFDRGALECVLRARVETAIHRGKGA